MEKKCQSLTGMKDRLPPETALWQEMESQARKIFHNYGFAEIRVPLLEDVSLFARGIGEGTQVVQKEMYDFVDKGGDHIALRPEGTAGVVRAFVENSLGKQEGIAKLYYMGPMFRYERPQKGRLREFHQIGVELMGVDSPHADAEVVIMLDRLVRSLAIVDHEIEINNLGTLTERQGYLKTLLSFFSQHKNELCADCQNRLEKNPLRIFDCKIPTCRSLCRKAPAITGHLGGETEAEFSVFKENLKKANVSFTVNPYMVRGLDYYEKTSFEFTHASLGAQNAFAGGGRYNHLIEELGGEATPAVGFAVGCERLIALMQARASADKKRHGVYLIGLNEQAFSQCRYLLQDLRDANVPAEMDFAVKSLKSSLRRADKLHCRSVIIIGEEELKKGSAVVKDLADGQQQEVALESLVTCFGKRSKP